MSMLSVPYEKLRSLCIDMFKDYSETSCAECGNADCPDECYYESCDVHKYYVKMQELCVSPFDKGEE